MDSSKLFNTNVLLIAVSALVFIIFLLLSYLFPRKRYERLHTLFIHLAFTCIPAFLIGVVDRVYLLEYFLEDTETLIKSRIVEPFGIYTGNLDKYGLKAMGPPLDFNKIFNDMEPGGTLLILDTVIPDIHKTFPSMRSAFDRGVKIKILVSHPDATITKLRAEEIGPEWDYNKSFRPAIYGYISHFQAIVAEDKKKRTELLEIRYYEDLPGMPMYILDNPGDNNDYLHHGYFLSSASVELPDVEFTRTNTGVFIAFLEYFNEKWERNKENKIDLVKFSGPGSLPTPKF
ncbi:MAG: hypothetical protein HY960_01605 [Ignavibacteriae bacterium]|nr:hypothetical protein [Ignavibacteriota bacterium]